MQPEEIGDSRRIEHCVLCSGADAAQETALQQLLPEGQSRFVAQTANFVAVPTFGCFKAGYVLVVPRRHVLSFGQLPAGLLAEAEDLVNELAGRISGVYRSPVLGFEYGHNLPGGRRVEHAHWHLLPSKVDLAGHLAGHFQERGCALVSLADLPDDPGSSYLAVRDQQGELTCHSVALDLEGRPRLRQMLAELDPEVDTAAWDWAQDNYPDLIRRTVADLAGH